MKKKHAVASGDANTQSTGEDVETHPGATTSVRDEMLATIRNGPPAALRTSNLAVRTSTQPLVGELGEDTSSSIADVADVFDNSDSSEEPRPPVEGCETEEEDFSTTLLDAVRRDGSVSGGDDLAPPRATTAHSGLGIEIESLQQPAAVKESAVNRELEKWNLHRARIEEQAKKVRAHVTQRASEISDDIKKVHTHTLKETIAKTKEGEFFSSVYWMYD